MKILRVSLAIILLVYSIPTFLSGLDIYKGQENDLSSEWIIVCLFFVLSFVFILLNFLESIKNK
jgi:undecaprenyl pyrophosphate phosphatase UppP